MCWNFQFTFKGVKMCRVLILDDDLRFGESLKPVVDGFEDGGTITEIATTVDQALHLAKEALLCGQPYAIFIIDQRLGLGMDGIEAMRELKSISPDSYAIILTGINDTEVGVRAYQAGAFRYLAKPVEEEELTFVLRSLMQSRREEVENKWRKVFSEMMERALHETDFRAVANVIVSYSLKLGFERAHLFWAPQKDESHPRDTFVGIECAGEGRVANFFKTKFSLPNKRILNDFLHSQDVIFLHESEASDEFKCELESIGYQYPSGGLWILPLWSRQELLGAVTLDFGKNRNYLNTHQHTLLNFLARQVSITLEHSGLYNREKRTSKEMELLQRASVEMLRIANLNEDAFWLTVLTITTASFGLEFNRALLFLMNDDHHAMVGKVGIGANDSEDALQGWKRDEERQYDLDSFIEDVLAKRVQLTPLNAFIEGREISLEEFGDNIRAAMENGQVIVLTEEEAVVQLPASLKIGYQPFACALLPIQAANNLLGFVIVDNKHNRVPLNKNSLRNLQTLLANAGLVWETRRQRARSEELLDVNYEILGGAGYQSLQETLNLICKTARNFSQANWASIYPIQKFESPPFYEFELDKVGCDGKLSSPMDIASEQPDVGGVSMHILQKGDLIVNNIDMENPMLSDGKLSERRFIQHENIKALAGIAIQNRYTREPLGILYLDYLQPHYFNNTEIRHANSFAHLAEVAISNSRRFADQRQRGLLQAANSISETVGAELNIEEVMAGIMNELKILFRSTSLCVLLYDEDENALKFAPRTLKYYEISNPEFQNVRVFPVDGRSGGSIACKVAKTALFTRRLEYLHIPNVKDEPDYLPLNLKTISELCVSLMGRRGDLLGVLALEREKRAFDNDDIAFVKMAAQQLGQAIERAQQSDQLAFKSTVATMTAWASDIAHDINSEIGLIRGRAYLLRQVVKDPQAVRYVNEINVSAGKLSSVGPWSEQAKKEISLDKSLQGFLESIVSQRNVELELHLQAPNAHIKVNPNEFKHVLRHLVRNSARAMEHATEKKISVSTRHLPDGRAEILFQDYGPGVDDEVRAAIFQRRTTTKTTSGGYGLLIARQLVEDINGKITLLPAEQGKGAVFSIKLPISIKQPTTKKTGSLNHVA